MSSGFGSSTNTDPILDLCCLPLHQSLTTHTDAKVLDAIIKEVGDWMESNERDGHWPYPQRARDAVRMLKEKSELSDKDLEDSHVKSVAIQLLASCYTDFKYYPSTSLPVALYVSGTRPTLISSLKMHGQYRLSPASGYHPRDSSPEPAWPGLLTGPSPEDLLAEQVSHRRKLVRLNSNPNKIVTMQEFMNWSNDQVTEEHYQPRRLSHVVDLVAPGKSSDSQSPLLSPQDSPEEEDLLVKHLGTRLKRSRSFWLGHIRPVCSLHADGSDDEVDMQSFAQRQCSTAPPEPKTPKFSFSRRTMDLKSRLAESPIQKRKSSLSKWLSKPALKSDRHPVFLRPSKGLKGQSSNPDPDDPLETASSSQANALDTDIPNSATVQCGNQTPFGHVSPPASASTFRRLSTWEETSVRQTPLGEKDDSNDEQGQTMSALEFLLETRRNPRDQTSQGSGEK